MTDLRRHMSPIMFEAVLYLKTNHEFWNLQMLAHAMKDTPDAKVAGRDKDTYYKEHEWVEFDG